jgi:adenylate cyclase class 2
MKGHFDETILTSPKGSTVTSYIEREIKVRVISPSLERVKEELMRVGKLISVEEQEDTYYAFRYRDFGATDEALRVRRANDKTELTYKGPRGSVGVKSREEVTISVDSADKVNILLQRLGFTPLAKIRKNRINFLYRDLVISLDQVDGLGLFIEFEGNRIEESELIREAEHLVRELGINGERENRTYLEMLMEEHGRMCGDTH